MKPAQRFFSYIILLSIIQTTHSVPPTKKIIELVMQSSPALRAPILYQLISDQYIDKGNAPIKLEKIKQLMPFFIDSISHLHKVPGFDEILHAYLKPSDSESSGKLYEIETALNIAKKAQNTQEHIIAMNTLLRIPGDRSKIEIDIMTNYRCIECKSGKWHPNPKENSPDTTKLKQQILTLQKTVLQYNQALNSSRLFMVHTKKKLPTCWQEWFCKQGISVFEEKE